MTQVTASERLAALEQRLGDHESRCEERLGEIRSTVATTLHGIESLKTRAWGVAAALLAWALAQVWTAEMTRFEHLESGRPAAIHRLAPPTTSA